MGGRGEVGRRVGADSESGATWETGTGSESNGQGPALRPQAD